MKYKTLSWFAVLTVLLLLWRAAEALGAVTQPSCTGTLKTLGQLTADGSIFRHLCATFARLTAALSAGYAAGIPAGILTGRKKNLELLLQPSLYLGYTIPKITLFPLAVLLFGLNNSARILITGLVIFFQAALAFRDGVKEIPSDYFTVLTSLGGDRMSRVKYLYIPFLLPKFLTSLRIGIAAGFAVVFFTESSAAGGYGLGRLVVDSWLRLDYPAMAAGALVTAVTGALLYLLLDIAEGKICSWQSASAYSR